MRRRSAERTRSSAATSAFFVFELPFWRLRLRMGHRARRRHPGPDGRRVRAAAEPRAHRPRPAAGRGRPHPPPGAGRAPARAAGDGLLARPLRSALLAAGHRLRRLLHRRARLAARARRGSPSSRCSARRLRLPDVPAGLALPRRPGSSRWSLFWIGGLGVYPSLLQRFRVTPNELGRRAARSSSTTSG